MSVNVTSLKQDLNAAWIKKLDSGKHPSLSLVPVLDIDIESNLQRYVAPGYVISRTVINQIGDNAKAREQLVQAAMNQLTDYLLSVHAELANSAATSSNSTGPFCTVSGEDNLIYFSVRETPYPMAEGIAIAAEMKVAIVPHPELARVKRRKPHFIGRRA